MNRSKGIYIIQFILLVLLQVYVLNNFELFGYVNPMVYLLFILTLPFETNRGTILLLSFFMGLSIDLLSGVPGLHAGASVALAFFRPMIIRQVSSVRDYESGIKPGISDLGISWFFKYAGIGVLLHHIVFFLFERFSFKNIDVTLKHIIVTALFSLLLIIVFQFLFYKRK